MEVFSFLFYFIFLFTYKTGSSIVGSEACAGYYGSPRSTSFQYLDYLDLLVIYKSTVINGLHEYLEKKIIRVNRNSKMVD